MTQKAVSFVVALLVLRYTISYQLLFDGPKYLLRIRQHDVVKIYILYVCNYVAQLPNCLTIKSFAILVPTLGDLMKCRKCKKCSHSKFFMVVCIVDVVLFLLIQIGACSPGIPKKTSYCCTAMTTYHAVGMWLHSHAWMTAFYHWILNPKSEIRWLGKHFECE